MTLTRCNPATFERQFMPKVRRSKKFKEYEKNCLRFASYLDRTSIQTFKVEGYDTVRNVRVYREVPYIHRFSAVYIRMLYAKLSKLQDWYKENPSPVFLLSLTTSSRDKTIKEAFEELREGWRGFSNCLRDLRKKYKKDIEYLYIYEPHKSGYPHMHVVLFADLTPEDEERLKRLWADKYGIGSYEHGLNISSPRKHQEIEHVRAYVLKYISKNLDFENMSTSHFVFLAVLWSFYDKSQWSWKEPYWTKTGKFSPKSTGGGVFRLWGASRKLTAVMKKEEEEFDATGYGINYCRYGEELPDILFDLSQNARVKIKEEFDSLN